MKKLLLIIITVFSLVQSNPSHSQIVINSSNGYSVNVVIMPKAIIPTGNSCQWGYNYNVRFDYSVIFSGNNKPSSLYTLQGTIGCGSASHFFSIPNTQGSGTKTSQSNVWRSTSDCASATVSSLFCNTVTLEIQGPGIPHQYVTFPVSALLLPVKLVQFNAEALKEKVKLHWETATEINTDHFTVERSLNGTDWSVVKTVSAAGNSSDLLAYTVYDENPVMGTTLYRIKSTDKNGSADYSATESVKFTGGSTISVYPVPNSGNTINFSGITEPASMIMTVIGMNGAALQTLASAATLWNYRN